MRYPTAGSDFDREEAQPFYVNSPYGIALAHNGNLTNSRKLTEDLAEQNRRHLNTTSDSEILLNVFAHALQMLGKIELSEQDIFKAVEVVHQRCVGAYAVVALIAGVGIVAFRDPYGIRPLVYGKKETQDGTEYMVASESVALDLAGFNMIADIAPGEAVFINKAGECYLSGTTSGIQYSPCLFEYVYLARPDSVIDKISVYKVRLRLGAMLAQKIKQTWKEHPIDVVMPIPDTSRPAAFVLAQELGIMFREGFVKNRYIGRTFIMPGQQRRRKSVRQKLNTINVEFEGKTVLLVDDSIVRGTTAGEIIQMARDAGAKKVYFASAAPEIRYPNVYGIDMPAAEELIAHDRDLKQIQAMLGADELIFQDFEALYEAAHESNLKITRFEDSVFTGNYLSGDIDTAYLNKLAEERQDGARNGE